MSTSTGLLTNFFHYEHRCSSLKSDINWLIKMKSDNNTDTEINRHSADILIIISSTCGSDVFFTNTQTFWRNNNVQLLLSSWNLILPMCHSSSQFITFTVVLLCHILTWSSHSLLHCSNPVSHRWHCDAFQNSGVGSTDHGHSTHTFKLKP